MAWTKAFREDIKKRRAFEDTCCMVCKNEDAGDMQFCPIHTKTMALNRKDPDFPKAIGFLDGGYTCRYFNKKI
jgi:hypothetical protein